MNSSWWVANYLEHAPALLVSQVVWVIGSICLHELAHGWAAIRHGDDTPIVTGHMTWSPLVHMGPWSLLMFAVVGIAWGLMPVNPSRMRGRHAEAVVALAGPAMNIALATLSIVLGGIWVSYGEFAGPALYENFRTFFVAGVYLNLILAVFNLLPVPPLDGSRILAHYVPRYRNLIRDPRAQTVSLILFLIVFFNAGEYIWGPAIDAAVTSIEFVGDILP
ncbi:MAG: site-2 protease family protein [Phycisphaerales bacterium]